MKRLSLNSLVAISTLLVTSLFTSAQAQNLKVDGGMPPTSMVFPMMYSQSVMVKFILGSYGKSDQEKIQAVKDAETAIAKFAKENRYVHRVENMKELEETKTLFFPNFYTLEDELNYRRSEEPPPFFLVSSNNHDVSGHIESLWTKQQERLEAIAKIPTVLQDKVENVSLNRLIVNIFNHSTHIKVAHMVITDLAITDQTRLLFVNHLHSEVEKGISQIEKTGTHIAGMGALEAAELSTQTSDPAKNQSAAKKQKDDAIMKRFFELAIGEYFKNIDIKEKVNIISTFLDNPDLSSPREKFDLMVMDSGPQFQKLFQVYADDVSDELKAIFKKLESNVRAVPFRLVKKMILAEPVPFTWVSISPKALGVGTMAQVHRAKIRLSSGEIREVIVRVLKPNIDQGLQADNVVLRIIAPIIDSDPFLVANRFSKITPFVEQIIGMGTKELNVPATTKAQKRGIVVYNKDMMVSSNGRPMKLRFHVPEVYDLGPNSQMMIQEFVPGMSFDAFEKKAPDLALRSIEALSKHWLDEALLGSGFFQADTHRGNLLVTATNDMIQINILDFGMSGQLTKRMQRQIIGAALIVKSGRSDLLAKALWEISIDKENTISLSQLTTLIRNKMAEIESAGEPELGVGDWIGDVTAAGMKFPDEFVSLKRGLTLIDKMLEKSKSKLSGADIITSSLLRNPRLLREATGSLNSITRGEWAKLAWDGVTGKNNQDSSNRPLPRTCGAIFTATP